MKWKANREFNIYELLLAYILKFANTDCYHSRLTKLVTC